MNAPQPSFSEALADLGCTLHETDRTALLAWLDSVECKAWEAADPLSCSCADPHLVDLYHVESRDAVARLCTRCGRSQA